MRILSFIIGVVLLLSISFCEADKCKSVSCPAGQTCFKGKCICNDGYEGSDCATASASKYLGTYLATETCTNGQSGSNYYPFIQQQSSRIAELAITNFLNQYQIVAYIRGDVNNTGNNIEIPEQQLGGTGTVRGQGVYQKYNSQERITINFEYTDGFQNKACTHTFYKQ